MKETNEIQPSSESYEGPNGLSAIKKQLDRLANVTGDILIAIKGNDMGTEGIIPRVEYLEGEQKELRDKIEQLVAKGKKRDFYIYVIVSLASVIAGSLGKLFIDYIMPIKK